MRARITKKKLSYALTSQGFSEPRRSGRSSKTPRKKCRALPPARWDLAVAAKTKKRSSTPASHCCAEIPAGIPAGIPQLTGRLQKNLVLCPAVPAPKGTVAVRAAGPLYIYPPPCLKHVLVCLGSKQQSLASMLNLDPNHNLNHQCSILILICNGSGCLALSFKGSRAQLVMLVAAPLPPRFCTHF